MRVLLPLSLVVLLAACGFFAWAWLRVREELPGKEPPARPRAPAVREVRLRILDELGRPVPDARVTIGEPVRLVEGEVRDVVICERTADAEGRVDLPALHRDRALRLRVVPPDGRGDLAPFHTSEWHAYDGTITLGLR